MKVYYHGGCTDGMTAAYIWSTMHPDATYIPVMHGKNEPVYDDINEDLVFLDFAPAVIPVEFKSLLIIDHHITSLNKLGLPTSVHHTQMTTGKIRTLTGIEFCGAMLTWTYLYAGYPRPRFVDYVNDRDLWEHKLPGTYGFTAFIQSQEKSIANWQRLFNMNVEDIIAKGQPLVDQVERLVKYICGFAYTVEICGYQVPCVNTNLFMSEVGHELSKGHPFAVSWIYINGQYKYSLRSQEDGIDVSEIAKKMCSRGGGHKHAAGFVLSHVIEK